VKISAAQLESILGPAPFSGQTTLPSDAAWASRGGGVVGVATGLAWTAVGGEVLFVESAAMAGLGKLSLTGRLGDVMKESVLAAISWLRANRVLLPKTSSKLIEQYAHGELDIHVHFPSGR